MIDGQFGVGENLDFFGLDIGCCNEEFCILVGVYLVEIDQFVEGILQRIDVEWVYIVGVCDL